MNEPREPEAPKDAPRDTPPGPPDIPETWTRKPPPERSNTENVFTGCAIAVGVVIVIILLFFGVCAIVMNN